MSLSVTPADVPKRSQRIHKSFPKEPPVPDGQEQKQLLFGPFRLDITNECLWRERKETRLHPKAFALLRYLVEHAGQLVTKVNLLQSIWPDVYVTEAVLSVYMAEIRKALGDDPKHPEYIKTLYGRGYRFITTAGDALPPDPIEPFLNRLALLAPIREPASPGNRGTDWLVPIHCAPS